MNAQTQLQPPQAQLELHTHMGMKGFFRRLEAFKGEYVYDEEGEHIRGENGKLLVHEYPGTRRLLQSSRPNKLLKSGLNVLNTQSGWMGYCQVGSGQDTPHENDTALQTWVASTNTIYADSSGARATIPFHGWRLRTYRFGEGVAAGILNEIAIGWASGPGDTIICRHKTVNVNNEEVSIVVQANEWLDATYELDYFPPLDDILGTITFDSVTFDTITRASQVINDAAWGDQIGNQMGQYSPTVSSWSAFDGELGEIWEAPDGASQACDNADQLNETYQNNSMQIVVVSNTGPTGWIMTGGFRCLRFMTTAGWFQTRFGQQGGGDEKVQKTDQFTMQIKWTLSWGELIAILAVPEPVTITGIDATLTYNP